MYGSSIDLKFQFPIMYYTMVCRELYLFLSKYTHSKSQPEPKCSFEKKCLVFMFTCYPAAPLNSRQFTMKRKIEDVYENM